MSTGNAVARKRRARGAGEQFSGESAGVIGEPEGGQVARWQSFVAQVEAGYLLGLTDYRNELDGRSFIALNALGPEVTAEDERFRKLLIHTRQAVWESNAPHAFWVCGYPKNASGALLSDLRHEGLTG
ncbi:MAG TPA: hypothetical protein VG273_17705 [Bryobacteraceae bacterium]|jgi:hypothetical protein|nr:hypothetical protein [Bryobacteraceae bacterium]